MARGCKTHDKQLCKYSLRQYIATIRQGVLDTSNHQTIAWKIRDIFTLVSAEVPMDSSCLSASGSCSPMSEAGPASPRSLGHIFSTRATRKPRTKMHWFSGRLW